MKKVKYIVALAIIIFFAVFLINKNDKVFYNINKKTYERNDTDYEAQYPAVTELKNKEIQNKVNQILKYTATEKWEKAYGRAEPINCTLRYEIKRKDNILSVQYRGWCWGDGTRANNLVFTANIDMKTGEQIDLKKKYFNKEIEQKIIEGKFNVAFFEEEYYKDYKERYGNKEIVKAIRESSIEKEDIFYLTKDNKLGIIISCYPGFFIIELEQ